jgi:hypothetical protein
MSQAKLAKSQPGVMLERIFDLLEVGWNSSVNPGQRRTTD